MVFFIENPPFGERREKKRFAFFPKKIGNSVVWLDFYLSIQVYEEYEENVTDPAWGVGTLPFKKTGWHEIEARILS